VNYGSDTESFDPLDLIGLLWQPLAKDRPLGRCSCRAIASPCAFCSVWPWQEARAICKKAQLSIKVVFHTAYQRIECHVYLLIQ